MELFQYNIALKGRKDVNIQSHTLSTYRPLLATIHTEFWGGSDRCKTYDVIFDTVIGRTWGGCFGIHIPPAYWYEGMRVNNHTHQLIIPDDKEEYLNQILRIKDRENYHTSFLVASCYNPARNYRPDVLVRVLFYDMLKDRYNDNGNNNTNNISIDALGRCRGDKSVRQKWGKRYISRGKDRMVGWQGVRDGAAEMALRYKFMIAMENTRSRGYLTEKFFNAMYGFTIPSYFGDDMIDTYFNIKRFINCNISDQDAKKLKDIKKEFKDNNIELIEDNIMPEVREIVGDRLNECIDRVIEIDKDDNLYKQTLMEPLFKDNKYDGSILDPFALINRFKQVFKFIDSYLLDQHQPV